MLESIRYRVNPYLKTKLIIGLGIGLIAFDVALATAFIQFSSNPIILEETLKMTDSAVVTLNPGE